MRNISMAQKDDTIKKFESEWDGRARVALRKQSIRTAHWKDPKGTKDKIFNMVYIESNISSVDEILDLAAKEYAEDPSAYIYINNRHWSRSTVRYFQGLKAIEESTDITEEVEALISEVVQ